MFFKMSIAVVLTFVIVGSVTAAGNSTTDTPTTQKLTTTPQAAPTRQTPQVSTPTLQEGKKCNIINRWTLVKSPFNHSSKFTDGLNVSIVKINRLGTILPTILWFNSHSVVKYLPSYMVPHFYLTTGDNFLSYRSKFF